MIARFLPSKSQSVNNDDFLKQLANASFRVEVASSCGQRTVLATHNSIYQRVPRAVVFPIDADVEAPAKLAADPEHRAGVLTPRCAGTGTNGQSLTHGIVVDLSRHMNSILEINAEERWVRVQSGSFKDQLNAAPEP